MRGELNARRGPLRPALTVSGLVVGAVLAVAPPPLQGGASDPESRQAAQEAYGTYCGMCHQFDGRGVQGTYPALDGSAIVNGDPRLLARLVLDGGFPNNAMPMFRATLSDADAAQILSYLRTAWGNSAVPVTEADIAARNEP
jgi:mono/diheme cytochrome c family protein